MNRALTISAAVGALALAACTETTTPPSGDVTIEASSVPAGARAVVIRVIGPATAAAPAVGTGYRVFSTPAGDTMRVAVIAPVGVSLAVGPLVRLSVPDRGAAVNYVVIPVQASNAANALVAASFTFTVTSP